MFSLFSRKKRHPLSVFLYHTFGFYPHHLELYELAFVHKSASLYYNKDFSLNNERLEFLGDAVLNMIVGEYLYYEFPNENEGFLTNLRSKIVNRSMLNEIAFQLKIPKHIKQQNEANTVVSNIYGNALEALIGAIFLDKGYQQTKSIVLNKILLPYIDLQFVINNETNYKGQIIDWAQKKHYFIEFVDKEITLNRSQPGFLCELFINKQLYGTGKGSSKKNAEQEASKDALQKLKLLK